MTLAAWQPSPAPSRSRRAQRAVATRDWYKGAVADALRSHGQHLRHSWGSGRWEPGDDWAHRLLPSNGGTRHRPRELDRRTQRMLPARRDYLADKLTVTVWEYLIGLADRVAGCRSVVRVRDDACGASLRVPISCGSPLCPDCERERQAAAVKRYAPTIAAARARGERWSLITLTVRNYEPGQLGEGVTFLRARWGRLRRRALMHGGRCRARATCAMPLDGARPGWRRPHRPIRGGLVAVEVTHSAAGGACPWHPHIHLLAQAPYIDQGELAAAWSAVTGGRGAIVDVRRVKRPEGAVVEAVKYVSKPTRDLLHRPAALAELAVALRGRRRLTAFGTLARLGQVEDEAGESADLVLVYPEPGAAPYRLPRVCPAHGAPATWRVLGTVRRAGPDPPARVPGVGGRTYYGWPVTLGL